MSTLKHFKQSVLPDGANAQLIQPSDWNHDHVLDPAVTGVLVDVNGTNAITGVAATTENTYLRRKVTGGPIAYEFGALQRVYALDYQFTRTPTGNLVAAAGQVMTLTSLPTGVSSTYSPLKHYIRIIDPVAGNETCLIQSVTATTITVNCTLAHTSGNYTITSATMGIQEAHYSFSFTVECYGPSGGRWEIWQTIFLYGGTTLNFDYSTIIFRMFIGANPLIKIEGLRPGAEWGGGVFNLFTGYAIIPEAAGYIIEMLQGNDTIFQNIHGKTIGSGIRIVDSAMTMLSCISLEYFSGVGFAAGGATSFTFNQYMARTDENGAIFYLPETPGTSGQFDTFAWQAGPVSSPASRGIVVRAGNGFSETSFVNGILDSMPIFLEYQAGAVSSYNNRFSNIGFFGGQRTLSANVTTVGTAVTWVSGALFTGLTTGDAFTIGGITYGVAGPATSTTATLTTSAGNQTNVPAAFNGISVFAVIGDIASNASFSNIDMYGASHTNGIIVFAGGKNIILDGVRIHGTLPANNGNRGIQLNGTVTDLTISNCSIGFDATLVQDPKMAQAIAIFDFPHQRIYIDGCKLYGAGVPIAIIGNPSYLRLGYNIGLDDTFVNITAAASITLSLNSIQAVAGTTVINTILGGWPGRKVIFIFVDGAPGGFGLGGNIAGIHPVTTNIAIPLMFINNAWY